MTSRKIALFGGTFDPIHLGHTTVAANVIKQINAENFFFIPARRSPLKGFSPRASDDDRLKMIALAIANNNYFELSDYELKKPEPSYTLETVRKFQADHGSDASIYWLIGADSIDDLPFWYRITDLLDECNLSAMYRAGAEPPDFTKCNSLWGPERIEKLQRNIIQTPLIDISSTEVRNRITLGQDVTDMLHPSVAEYIKKHGLYQSKDNTHRPQ